MPSVTPDPPVTAGSQTLDRGLRALEILADHGTAMSITALADSLGVHRSSAYRILRTLEDHRFVLRDSAGLITLGPRLAALGRGAAPALSAIVLPELTALANELGMTAFVTVLDADEAITLLTIAPSHARATVAQRPGARHHIRRGAPSHAIESILTPAEHHAAFGDQILTDAGKKALELGFAVSHDEVIHGVTSIAVPFRVHGEPPAALAVVTIGIPEDLQLVTASLRNAAGRIVYNAW